MRTTNGSRRRNTRISRPGRPSLSPYLVEETTFTLEDILAARALKDSRYIA